MFSLLQIIDLGPQATDGSAERMAQFLIAEGESLPAVVSAKAGTTLPGALFGGHLMWRLTFASEEDYRHCQTSDRWHSIIAPALAADKGVFVDRVAYQPRWFDTSAGRSREGIWRCLVLAVDADASRTDVRQFEQDMLLMPSYVSTIRNWSFGHVIAARGRRRWTHVWEQEFDDMAGLNGEYMANPIHWGLVDGWYDPESPKRIVDIVCIVHAAFAIDRAVII